MVFSFEIVITIGFWSFCFTEFGAHHGIRQWCLFMDHTIPFTCLMIDFLAHRIHYETAQMCINMIFLGFYAVDNFGFSKARDTYVYPVIHWDSWLSWIAALAVVPLYMLLWVAINECSACKLKKYGFDKPDPEMAAAMKSISAERDDVDDTMTMPTFKSDNDVPFEDEVGASLMSKATGKDGINMTASEISESRESY